MLHHLIYLHSMFIYDIIGSHLFYVLIITMCIHRFFFTVVVLLSACAVAPSGNNRRIISKVDNGNTVVVLFATQLANEQYCVYKNELTSRTLTRNPALAFAFETATGLTTHSVSAKDLSEALLLESAHTSRAYNTALSALYPLLICGGSLVSLPILPKKLLPAGIALLSCGAAALFIHKATSVQTEGETLARTSVEQLLADETHANENIVNQLPRVLPWLVTENALPCPSTPKTQQEISK